MSEPESIYMSDWLLREDAEHVLEVNHVNVLRLGGVVPASQPCTSKRWRKEGRVHNRGECDQTALPMPPPSLLMNNQYPRDTSRCAKCSRRRRETIWMSLFSSSPLDPIPDGRHSTEKKTTNHNSGQRAIGRCLAILVAWVWSRRRG